MYKLNEIGIEAITNILLENHIHGKDIVSDAERLKQRMMALEDHYNADQTNPRWLISSAASTTKEHILVSLQSSWFDEVFYDL